MNTYELESLTFQLDLVSDALEKDLPNIIKAEKVRADDGDSAALDVAYQSLGFEARSLNIVSKAIFAIAAMIVKIRNFIRNLYLKLTKKAHRIDKELDELHVKMMKKGFTFRTSKDGIKSAVAISEWITGPYKDFTDKANKAVDDIADAIKSDDLSNIEKSLNAFTVVKQSLVHEFTEKKGLLIRRDSNFDTKIGTDASKYFNLVSLHIEAAQLFTPGTWEFTPAVGRGPIDTISNAIADAVKGMNDNSLDKTLEAIQKGTEAVENLEDPGPLGDAARAVNNYVKFKASVDMYVISYAGLFIKHIKGAAEQAGVKE